MSWTGIFILIAVVVLVSYVIYNIKDIREDKILWKINRPLK